MPVTFVSDSKQAISNAASVVVAAPAGLADGDTLVLVLGHGNAATLNSTPSGWTFLAQGLGNMSLTIYTRQALASDTSWTFPWAGTYSGSAWCGAYRGGWVQTAQAKPSSVYQLFCPTYAGSTNSGIRIDVMQSRRDNATAAIHANPAWTVRRAYLDGTNGSRHMEMSVGELTTVGYNYSPDSTWSLTDPATSASYLHLHAVIWLASASQPADLVYEPVAVTVPAKQAWVYKGRARSIDDTVEVP